MLRREPDPAHRRGASADPGRALYDAFPAPEAHRTLRRPEFHYTPKHASWLIMAEVEIGVMRGQCLDRRIGGHEVLVGALVAWENQRTAAGARVNWMFTTARAYPNPTKES